MRKHLRHVTITPDPDAAVLVTFYMDTQIRGQVIYELAPMAAGAVMGRDIQMWMTRNQLPKELT